MKGKLKVLLLVFLVLLTVLNSYAYTVGDVTVANQPEEKLGYYLKSQLDNNNGQKYNIIVCYDDVKEETIQNQLRQRGYNEEIFRSEQDFNEQISEEIAAEKGTHYTDADLHNYKKEKARKYKQERKNIIKSETKKINDKVYDKLMKKYDKDITYKSEYMPLTQMYTDINTIKELAKSEYVKEIIYIDDSEMVAPTPEHTNTMTAVNLNYNNIKTQYDGTGIKVAVIDSKYCDTNYIMLKNKGDKLNLVRCSKDTISTPSSTDLHSTLVTSLICGNETTHNKKQYVGIAPNCTMYSIPLLSREWLSSALDLLVSLDIDVANISLETKHTGNMIYTEHDKIIDKYTYVYKFTVVKSAGNYGGNTNYESTITSPGLSYNAITVGNVNTKSTSANGKYNMCATSSWNQLPNHCNKPDVVAPGTDISMPQYSLPSGTSWSAPIVTGAVALLLDARPYFITEPFAIKSELMVYANSDIINDEPRDAIYSPLIKEKSGAGLIDIYNTVKRTYQNRTFVHCPKKTSSFTGTQEIYTTNVTIPANKTFKAAISWVQPFNGSADNSATSIPIYNLDLKLVDAETGTILANSSSLYNNVELISYTPYEQRVCKVVITLKDFVKPANFSSYPLYYGYSAIIK